MFGSTFYIMHEKQYIFFEISVLFGTGELNTYVYDSGGLYRRKFVSDGRQGENNDDHSRGRKASPVHSDTGITEAHERTAQRPLAGR